MGPGCSFDLQSDPLAVILAFLGRALEPLCGFIRIRHLINPHTNSSESKIPNIKVKWLRKILVNTHVLAYWCINHSQSSFGHV